jgi:hypothetical protein
MEKNEEEGGKYYDSDLDISIPVENTTEYKKAHENDMVTLIPSPSP